MPLSPRPLPRRDPRAECLPAIVLNLLKFAQWVLWKCSTCHELNGKAKHNTCTHRQRHLWTQTFLLDWGAAADGSGTNQLACKYRATRLQGNWKVVLRSCGHALQAEPQELLGCRLQTRVLVYPSLTVPLIRTLSPPSLGFPVCQVRLRMCLPQMG